MNMKRFLSAVPCLILPFMLLFIRYEAAAQERAVDTLFSRYTRAEGFTSVTYGNKMLEMMKDGASCELQELLDGIDVIRIISTGEQSGKELSSEAREMAVSAGYGLVSEVSGNEHSAAFFFKDESCGMSSFLMVSETPDGTAVLDIYGIFDIKDISKLSGIPPGHQSGLRKDL